MKFKCPGKEANNQLHFEKSKTTGVLNNFQVNNNNKKASKEKQKRRRKKAH